MIGYVTVGVSDMEKAKAFYGDLFSGLGAKVLFDKGRIAMIGKSMQDPMIAVCIPFNQEEPTPGNGSMISISAGTKEQAAKLYHKAIELGATCEGEPGQRLADFFYGAYVRDPDGNKLCFYVFG